MTAGSGYPQGKRTVTGDRFQKAVRALLGLWSRTRERGLRLRAGHRHLGQALALGFAAWASTRIAFVLLTALSTIMIRPNLAGHSAPAPGTPPLQVLVLPWGNWDGAWYISIAANGYGSKATTAFFPLYPLLVRLWAGVVHHLFTSASPWLVASLLASNASLLVALIALALLVLSETDDRHHAALVLALVLAYPVAFFLTAGYSESTSLALVSMTLLFARRGWWIPAGIAGALAALTHATNVLVALVIAWEFGRQHGWWSVADWKNVALWRRVAEVAGGIGATLATPAGLALYMAYLWQRFGSPLTFATVETTAGRKTVPPWQLLTTVPRALGGANGTLSQLYTGWDAGLLLAFLVIVVLAARRLPVSFTLYAASLVLATLILTAPLLPDPLMGAARYLMPAVPVFLGLGVLLARRPGAQVAVVSFSFLLQGMLAVVWVLGGFVE